MHSQIRIPRPDSKHRFPFADPANGNQLFAICHLPSAI
jgi:hypothetical protein